MSGHHGPDALRFEDQSDEEIARKEEASFRVRYEASQEALTETLAGSLDLATKLDSAYLERNQLVAALSKLYPAGLKRTAIEGWDPEWHGCVFIDLPTGQASWHFHDRDAHMFAHLGPYAGEWDGHSTELKYKRLLGLKP